MTQNYEIIRWIGLNCFSKLKAKEGVVDVYWAFNEEAADFYDGEFDKRLNYYTTEELIGFYERINKNRII